MKPEPERVFVVRDLGHENKLICPKSSGDQPRSRDFIM